jgi:hypothetical protein
MRPLRTTALFAAGTSILLSATACAAPGTTPGTTAVSARAAVPAAAPAAGARPCPTSKQWLDRPAPAPSGNTPQADELAAAVGAQGRGAFARVYGTLIVDFPVGHVALCVTDLGRRLFPATSTSRSTLKENQTTGLSGDFK